MPVAQGHKRVTVSATCYGFDPNSRKLNIFFNLYYIFISTLWCRDKARRWVPPINIQCLQNSAENWEWSVLTLDTLCLWDTANWFIFILLKKKNNIIIKHKFPFIRVIKRKHLIQNDVSTNSVCTINKRLPQH